MGNIMSVKNMLHAVGYDDVLISGNPTDIERAHGVILPGVGAFDYGMNSLRQRDLIDPLTIAVIDDCIPILGICLGMQLLGIDSEEGSSKGLGFIPFHTKRFRLNKEYKIPHMGWDDVTITNQESPLLKYVSSYTPRYYFVHSYYAFCDEDTDVLMKCNYGGDFVAAVSRGNVYGVQFHPEKSHKYGMEILKGFIDIVG